MLSVSHIVLADVRGKEDGSDNGFKEEITSLHHMIFIFVSVLGLVKVAGLGTAALMLCINECDGHFHNLDYPRYETYVLLL